MDKETFDSLPLTRWPNKSGKRIEGHPELPPEHEAKETLKRNPGMPMEMMLKSKIIGKHLKQKATTSMKRRQEG